MALVGAALTAERVAPSRERVARAVGALLLGMGLFLVFRRLVAA
jgi:hypothetical protein